MSCISWFRISWIIFSHRIRMWNLVRSGYLENIECRHEVSNYRKRFYDFRRTLESSEWITQNWILLDRISCAFSTRLYHVANAVSDQNLSTHDTRWIVTRKRNVPKNIPRNTCETRISNSRGDVKFLIDFFFTMEVMIIIMAFFYYR